jgi:multidrug efflux pump subunit AcrA (membrane-fusion protein)
MRVRFNERTAPADVQNGVRVPYAPAARPRRRWRWYILLLLVASPLLYFVISTLRGALFVTAPAYISLEHVDVRAPIAGIVTAIRVNPGSHVKAGDVLVDLRNPSLDARRNAIEAELRVLGVPSGVHSLPPSAMPSAPQQSVDLLSKRVGIAQAQLAVNQKLESEGAATAADVASAQAQVFAAQSDLVRARADATAPAESTGPNLSIVSLQGDLAGLNAQLSGLHATATQDGAIAAVPVMMGESVDAGASLATIALNRPPVVRAFLDPKDADFGNVGHHAWVTYPTRERISAHVTKISRIAHQVPTSFVSPLASRADVLEITLAFDSALPSDMQNVDGLPVKVWFEGTRL